MKIANQSFPHPVLGLRDDITGKFNVGFEWSCDRETYFLFPVFDLNNAGIEKLISENKAKYVIHVECANTFFRESFTSSEKSPVIKINADELRDKVDVRFFISVVQTLSGYINKDSHEDYLGYEFDSEVGDILAAGKETSFQAEKNYESLRAVSSIMLIKKGEYNVGVSKINYSENKIILELSKENFQIYNESKNDKRYLAFLHLGLVFPVLFKALQYVATDDDDFKKYKWFDVLKTRIDDENLSLDIDGENHFEVLQKLFGNPMDRFFSSITNIKEELENE